MDALDTIKNNCFSWISREIDINGCTDEYKTCCNNMDVNRYNNSCTRKDEYNHAMDITIQQDAVPSISIHES